MLRVTVELIPQGVEDQRKLLGVIGITNDGSGSLETGNYTIELSDEPPFTSAGNRSIWRRLKLKGFKRRAFGPYHLLLAALLEAIPHEERP